MKIPTGDAQQNIINNFHDFVQMQSFNGINLQVDYVEERYDLIA